MDVLLSCGCRANSVDHEGKPSCVIHAGLVPDIHVVPEPDLTGREAKCYCGNTEMSSLARAFFQFKGEGSPYSKNHCKNCGYTKNAHTRPDTRARHCGNFEPTGAAEYDEYYCGCHGWD